MDCLLLALDPVLLPHPGGQRLFMHASGTSGLGHGLIRLNSPLHRAFLKGSGIFFRRGLAQRTHRV